MRKESILKVIKEIFLSAELLFSTKELEDGTVIKTDSEDFIVGSLVTVETPEGEFPLEDGDYKIKDGSEIKIESGIITEVKEVELEEEVKEVEEEIKEEEVELSKDNELSLRIEALENKIISLQKDHNDELEKFKLASIEMAKEIETLSNEPAVETISLKKEVEYKDMTSFQKFMFEKTLLK